MDTSTKGKKPHHKGSAVLFKNPLLERLTRTPIVVPIAIFVVFTISLIYWTLHHALLSLWAILIVFPVGFLTFTLIEYFVHRSLFHMVTDTKTKAKIQYIFHGVHHDYPRDKKRLAMPPLVSITITVFLFLIFKLIMNNYTFAFLPGFLVGYASYLLIHYAIHAYQPPNNFLKHLWINHSIHHYKDPERAFGVSSPLWDYIFRTIPKK